MYNLPKESLGINNQIALAWDRRQVPVDFGKISKTDKFIN
jgi:hypothetical protein